MLRRYTLTGHTYLNRTPAAEHVHLSLIGFKAFSVIDGIGTRISLIGFKGFLVLDGFGTDQPHAYNGSGCIPPTLWRYEGRCNALKLDTVERLFGSGRFWNDQPHAYNGSGCIPPSLQRYEGRYNALKLDRVQRLFGSWRFFVACCKSNDGKTKARRYRFGKRSYKKKLTSYLELIKSQ